MTIRNRGHYGEVRNALSVGEDTEGGFTVPDEFEKKLVEALEENNIFRGMATVIRTSSGTRKIPIAEDTGEASWIDEGEEIPESDTTFGQTMLSAYKLGTMIKISNELLNDSAFDLATYIARRFGVRMGNAEERAFITGDGVGKPLGLLAETGGAKVGVTAAQKDAVTFDEIFKLYYALKAPYRKKAQFLCNEALVLQLMTIKDNNGNYIWKPGLEIGKPDTLLNRPLKTSAFMPEIKGGSKVITIMAVTKKIEIDGKEVTFKASAAVPRLYRIKFGRDIYKDLRQLEKSVGENDEDNSNLDLFSLEMFEDLAWLMARHADPAKVPDSPEEFLDQFNTFSIYQILPQLIELWGLNVQTEVESRKNLEKVSGK